MIILTLSIVVCPNVIKSHASIILGTTVIGLVAAVLLASGFSFDVSNYDITDWITTKINDYLTANNYLTVSDWLGADFERDINVSGKFLGIPFQLWLKLKAAVDWMVQVGNLPQGGSVSSPVNEYVLSNEYIAEFILDGVSYYDIPVYNSILITLNSYSNGAMYSRLLSKYITSSIIIPTSMFDGNTHNFSSNTYNYTPIFSSGINSGGYWYGGNRYGFGYGSIVLQSNTNRPGMAYDSRLPIYLIFLRNNGVAWPLMIYYGVDGQQYTVSNYTNNNGMYFDIYSRNGSLNVTSNGNTQYPSFNNSDPVYIDLQIGDLTSSLSSLTDLIIALNQNLVEATIALQEASQSDLPVDTTPFKQLVDSYEEVTNDVISGDISITSGLSSMYTLLAGSLQNITNPALSDACINAYNAFVNKLSLFQSAGGGSTPNYTYTTVQTLQGQLDTLYNNYQNGNITYDSMLTAAANDLSLAVEDAISTQEIISLNSVYQSFLQMVGAVIEGSTYSKGVVQQFDEVLEDYADGTISRSAALTQLKSIYQLGMASAKTAVDVGVIISGYQAALDQIAVDNFTITTTTGDLVTDVTNMESDLVGQIDLDQFEAYIDFNNWRFLPQSEAGLYREYFQRIMDSQSPFYVFIYIPLILSMVGIILGSRIYFRRSYNTNSGKTDK